MKCSGWRAFSSGRINAWLDSQRRYNSPTVPRNDTNGTLALAGRTVGVPRSLSTLVFIRTTIHFGLRISAFGFWTLALASLWPMLSSAGTLTLRTNSLGTTPALLAYNAAHSYPGSNTREWWRYSGVSGARVFLTASLLDSTQDLAASGVGITNQSSFLARKAAVRAAPLSTTYINWSYITNRYGIAAFHGANLIQPNYLFSQLRQIGVQILVNISASPSSLVITNASDWTGKYELWQFYYAQAFYLASHFDVQRFQMYNEPDLASGLTQSDYLQRLQLASDAIQAAVADANSLYAKSLTPSVHAAVLAASSYNGWAQLVITNRHQNFLGQTDSSFWVLHNYDYHQYNSTPAGFASNLAALRSAIASATAPEPMLPTSISEFNVHTAGNFDTMPDTLDWPSKYPRFGAIAVNLVQNLETELYCFKFGQTVGDPGDAYPLRKNGMHYIDNDTAPYNTGGVTKAGEVWRLFNKAFAPGRQRRDFSADSGLANLSLLASYDPATGRSYIFSANNSASNTTLLVDVSALKIPDNNRVVIEEVSESCYGAIANYTHVLGGQVGSLIQPSNSVWLLTIPGKAQQLVSPNEPTLTVKASDDATVKDSANKNLNFGSQTNLLVRNDPSNASNRSAALIKFHLPAISLPQVELAVLSVYGSTVTTNTPAQAFVYGLTNNNWTQTTITWANAPNLRQNVAAGNHITNAVINGAGDSAFVEGQLVFSTTNFTEQQIDVTDFIRSRTNSDASFLVLQDPRWNLTLPALEPGDTQPDGVQLISLEGGGANLGPRLKIVRLPLPAVGTTGDNSFGQCDVPAPATNVVAVAAGAWHSLALRADGNVVAWGDNDSGQCDAPASLTNAVAIAAGGYHSLAIKASGAVAAWGANDDGQTSVPPGLANVIGIAAGAWHSLALRFDGRVVAWGDNSLGQTNVPAGLSNVIAVAAGGNHSLALKSDGTVSAWGENTDAHGNFTGQSVVPLGLSNVLNVAAGQYHSLAVKNDGTITAWGDNSEGQCSVPTGLSNVVAIAAGAGHSLALRTDGSVAAWGANWSGQCNLSAAWTPAVGMAAGSNHTLVLPEGGAPVLRLLSPAWKQNRFSAIVQTLNRKNYALEFRDSLSPTNWTLLPGVAGNGALRVLTNSTAAVPHRFYRSRQW